MSELEDEVRTVRIAAALVCVVLVVTLGACAGSAAETATPAPSVSDDSKTDEAEASVPASEVPGQVLEAIVAEAAQRAGVEPEQVEITAAEAVTWSDGSLGCPEAGMMYTQALVPGYRVILEAGGEELHFHASENGQIVFCDDPQPPAATDE